MKLLLALVLAAPAAFAQVRVEARALVKEQRWFFSGGLGWLDRRDYYENPGATLSASYYLREDDAVELRTALFASHLNAAGDQVVQHTGLVPDAQRPVALLLAGWRHSLAYGKVAAGSKIIHFDLQSGLHAGTLVTDRAATPAVSASIGGIARLGERFFGQIDFALLGSIESRTSTVFAVGFMPTLAIGVSL